MSYNIPTSGQIRLGYDFNRCFYHGASNSAQLNFNDQKVRETSVSINQSSDTSYTSGAQKNLSAYRGATGARGWIGTTTSSNVSGDQSYQQEVEAGTGSATSRVAFNVDSTYNRVDYQYAANGGTTGNTAANGVCYLGYLEPGNYQVGYYIRQYNAGYCYVIVRGYTTGYLSGSYSNYVYQSNYHFSGSFDDFASGGTSFTTNSTYPYVILDVETHNDNQYFNRAYVLRKGNSYGSSYNANPYVKRV